jgi:hypothetical protein
MRPSGVESDHYPHYEVAPPDGYGLGRLEARGELPQLAVDADSRQAISAKTTASGSDPPAYAAPAGIEAAIAAPRRRCPSCEFPLVSRKKQ